MNLATGKRQWTFHRTSIYGSAAAPDVVAVSDGTPATTTLLDATTGAQRWAITLDSTSAAAWAITDHTVVTLNGPNTLYALDRAGHRSWRWNVPGSDNSTPATQGDHLWFTSNDGQIHDLNTVTGAIEWSADLGLYTRTAPTIDGTRVLTRASTTPNQGLGDLVALDAASGKVLWRRPVRAAASWPTCGGCDPGFATSITVQGNVGYVAIGARDGSRGLTVAFDTSTGRIVQSAETEGWPGHTIAVDSQRIYLLAKPNHVRAITHR
jgi:outer membrane protein assembly factor BamB